MEAEQKYRASRNSLKRYNPYPKQKLFHDAGLTHRERLFSAGNQQGKTWAGGSELAMHLTGLYPDWWEGRIFDTATDWWVGGVTTEAIRTAPQKILLGDIRNLGTGTVPADCIVGSPTLKRGVPDAVDTFDVRHVSGGSSKVSFKSYDQGREKWQGATLQGGLWFDEEPPEDIYSEGMTRINATDGIIMITFTPLLGMSEVVKKFYPIPSTKQRSITQMTIDDAGHISAAQREIIINSYPEHEREARVMGIPQFGSGRVFPVSESEISEDAVQVPKQWAQIAGMDFGWDHPTAVVWLAHDRDNDVVHVIDCYRTREQTPVFHAAAIKKRGRWIPVAWPHDGLQHDKGSGEQLAQQYRDQDVNMISKRATYDDGSNGLEAGIMDMIDRMKTGRFKVARHLQEWWDEYRVYHRKDGVIVKKDDDLMSATRYALMMLRCADVEPRPYRATRKETGSAWAV